MLSILRAHGTGAGLSAAFLACRRRRRIFSVALSAATADRDRLSQRSRRPWGEFSMTVAGPASDPHPAKLAFWSTVGRAYAAPFADAQSLMRAARLWLLLLTPVLLFTSWLQMSMRAELLAGMRADAGAAFAMGWQLRLISNLHSLVIVPAAASIAVAWHRLILNGERPADVYLRFDRIVWLYAAFLLATLL